MKEYRYKNAPKEIVKVGDKVKAHTGKYTFVGTIQSIENDKVKVHIKTYYGQPGEVIEVFEDANNLIKHL